MSRVRRWRIRTASVVAVLERQVDVDGRERLLDPGRVGGVLDDGGDQLVLVGEDAEDRALGDAGGLGDLARGDHLAVLEQQGEHGLDDHRPPLVGRQRFRSARLGGGSTAPDGGGHGGSRYVSADSLTSWNRDIRPGHPSHGSHPERVPSCRGPANAHRWLWDESVGTKSSHGGGVSRGSGRVAAPTPPAVDEVLLRERPVARRAWPLIQRRDSPAGPLLVAFLRRFRGRIATKPWARRPVWACWATWARSLTTVVSERTQTGPSIRSQSAIWARNWRSSATGSRPDHEPRRSSSRDRSRGPA